MAFSIDELQFADASRNIAISDLLRNALIVAAKLDLPSVPHWLKKELEGYGAGGELPSHRVLRGLVKAKIPFQWVPV